MVWRAWISKAGADLSALNQAITMYREHMGSLPATFVELTRQTTNAQGVTRGAFIANVPTPPASSKLDGYLYKRAPNGMYLLKWLGPDIVDAVCGR